MYINIVKEGEFHMQNSITKNQELDDIFEDYKLSEEGSSKIQDTIHIGSTIDYIPYWKYFNIEDDVCLNYWYRW